MLPERFALRSPAPPFSLCRVNAPDDFPLPAFRRSRKLGTAFRSLITTLSRHYEVNAPALFLRFHAGTHCESVRSETVPLDIGFRHRIGRIQRFRPVVRATSHRCAEPPVPTPLWAFQPSGSKRSTGSSCNKPALPDARSFPAPEAVSFDPALNARKAVFAVAWLSFRKPWN
jgi:hypothetical protein